MKNNFLLILYLIFFTGFIFADTPSETEIITPTSTEAFIITETQTNTPTFTNTEIFTQIETYTYTIIPTLSYTKTISPTFTETFSDTITITFTDTLTQTFSPTRTETPGVTFSLTNTLSVTPSFTITLTATNTPTESNTPTITNTLTPFYTTTISDAVFELVKENLYPNPAKYDEEIFMLYDFDNNTNIEIVIYTLDGRVAYRTERKNLSGRGKISFYLKNFAPGIYFYQVIKYSNNATKKNKTLKLIINR